VDVATLARAQAVNRVVIGAGLMALPGVFGRNWIGPAAKDARSKVLARSLGARDLITGAAGLLALKEDDREWARWSFAAQAWADAVDFAAILAAGREVPLTTRLVGGTLAAGSAAVAAAYARELASAGHD